MFRPNFFPTSKPAIAIVIPCYEHAPSLKEMFESIQQQTIAPNEVIFIVDKSPDNSLQILQGLINENQHNSIFCFILLENETNLGQAANLNKGIGFATTELIMILNDNDYLMHDSIEVNNQILNKYPYDALLGGHSLHFDADELQHTTKLIESICLVIKLK